MKYQFKGIIRGAFSDFQAAELETYMNSVHSIMLEGSTNQMIIEPVVRKLEGDDLHSLLDGLAIDEWCFVLKVNGRRVKNVLQYIKRKGLDPSNYLSIAQA